MKQKILIAALIQFGIAATLTIAAILLRSFESYEDIGTLARVYIIATIFGVTGLCSGLIGAVYPKEY